MADVVDGNSLAIVNEGSGYSEQNGLKLEGNATCNITTKDVLEQAFIRTPGAGYAENDELTIGDAKVRIEAVEDHLTGVGNADGTRANGAPSAGGQGYAAGDIITVGDARVIVTSTEDKLPASGTYTSANGGVVAGGSGYVVNNVVNIGDGELKITGVQDVLASAAVTNPLTTAGAGYENGAYITLGGGAMLAAGQISSVQARGTTAADPGIDAITLAGNHDITKENDAAKDAVVQVQSGTVTARGTLAAAVSNSTAMTVTPATTAATQGTGAGKFTVGTGTNTAVLTFDTNLPANLTAGWELRKVNNAFITPIAVSSIGGLGGLGVMLASAPTIGAGEEIVFYSAPFALNADITVGDVDAALRLATQDTVSGVGVGSTAGAGWKVNDPVTVASDVDVRVTGTRDLLGKSSTAGTTPSIVSGGTGYAQNDIVQIGDATVRVDAVASTVTGVTVEDGGSGWVVGNQVLVCGDVTLEVARVTDVNNVATVGFAHTNSAQNNTGTFLTSTQSGKRTLVDGAHSAALEITTVPQKVTGVVVSNAGALYAAGDLVELDGTDATIKVETVKQTFDSVALGTNRGTGYTTGSKVRVTGDSQVVLDVTGVKQTMTSVALGTNKGSNYTLGSKVRVGADSQVVLDVTGVKQTMAAVALGSNKGSNYTLGSKVRVGADSQVVLDVTGVKQTMAAVALGSNKGSGYTTSSKVRVGADSQVVLDVTGVKQTMTSVALGTNKGSNYTLGSKVRVGADSQVVLDVTGVKQTMTSVALGTNKGSNYTLGSKVRVGADSQVVLDVTGVRNALNTVALESTAASRGSGYATSSTLTIGNVAGFGISGIHTHGVTENSAHVQAGCTALAHANFTSASTGKDTFSATIVQKGCAENTSGWNVTNVETSKTAETALATAALATQFVTAHTFAEQLVLSEPQTAATTATKTTTGFNSAGVTQIASNALVGTEKTLATKVTKYMPVDAAAETIPGTDSAGANGAGISTTAPKATVSKTWQSGLKNDLVLNDVTGVVKNMYIFGTGTTGTKVSSVDTTTNTVTLDSDLSTNASGNYTFKAGKDTDSTIVFAAGDATNIKVGHFIRLAVGGNAIPYVASRAATGASGQKVLTFTDVTGIVVGQWVSGTGIDPTKRVKVDSVDSTAKTVTLSHDLVAAASGNYAFYVAVTAVADNTVTLSAALTGDVDSASSHTFTTSAGFSGQNRILFTTADITNVVVGHPVSGTGIPAGTTVTGIVTQTASGSTSSYVSLSSNLTNDVSGTYTFEFGHSNGVFQFPPTANLSDVTTKHYMSGSGVGIATGMLVTAVNNTNKTVTVSQIGTTGTASGTYTFKTAPEGKDLFCVGAANSNSDIAVGKFVQGVGVFPGTYVLSKAGLNSDYVQLSNALVGDGSGTYTFSDGFTNEGDITLTFGSALSATPAVGAAVTQSGGVAGTVALYNANTTTLYVTVTSGTFTAAATTIVGVTGTPTPSSAAPVPVGGTLLVDDTTDVVAGRYVSGTGVPAVTTTISETTTSLVNASTLAWGNYRRKTLTFASALSATPTVGGAVTQSSGSITGTIVSYVTATNQLHIIQTAVSDFTAAATTIAGVTGTFTPSSVDGTQVVRLSNDLTATAQGAYQFGKHYTIVDAGNQNWTNAGAANSNVGTGFVANATTTGGADGKAVETYNLTFDLSGFDAPPATAANRPYRLTVNATSGAKTGDYTDYTQTSVANLSSAITNAVNDIASSESSGVLTLTFASLTALQVATKVFLRQDRVERFELKDTATAGANFFQKKSLTGTAVALTLSDGGTTSTTSTTAVADASALATALASTANPADWTLTTATSATETFLDVRVSKVDDLAGAAITLTRAAINAVKVFDGGNNGSEYYPTGTLANGTNHTTYTLSNGTSNATTGVASDLVDLKTKLHNLTVTGVSKVAVDSGNLMVEMNIDATYGNVGLARDQQDNTYTVDLTGTGKIKNNRIYDIAENNTFENTNTTATDANATAAEIAALLDTQYESASVSASGNVLTFNFGATTHTTAFTVGVHGELAYDIDVGTPHSSQTFAFKNGVNASGTANATYGTDITGKATIADLATAINAQTLSNIASVTEASGKLRVTYGPHVTAAANTDDLLKRYALKEKRRYAVGAIAYKTAFTINSTTTGLVTSTALLVIKLNENNNSGLSAVFSKHTDNTSIDLLWKVAGAQTTPYNLTKHASIVYTPVLPTNTATNSTFPYSLDGGTNYTQITNVADIVGITPKDATIQTVLASGTNDVVIAFNSTVTAIGTTQRNIFKRNAQHAIHDVVLPTGIHNNFADAYKGCILSIRTANGGGQTGLAQLDLNPTTGELLTLINAAQSAYTATISNSKLRLTFVDNAEHAAITGALDGGITGMVTGVTTPNTARTTDLTANAANVPTTTTAGTGANLTVTATVITGIVTSVSAPAGADTDLTASATDVATTSAATTRVKFTLPALTNTPVAGDTVTQASGASGTVVSYTANGNDSKLVVDVGAGTFANAQTTTVNFQNVAHANETPTPTAIVTSSGTGDGLGSNLELSPTLTTGIVTSVSAPAGADTDLTANATDVATTSASALTRVAFTLPAELTNTPQANDTVTQAGGASGTVVSYTANGDYSKLVVDVATGTFSAAQITVAFAAGHANETPTPTAIITSNGGDGFGSNLELSPTLTTGIVTSVSAPNGADTDLTASATDVATTSAATTRVAFTLPALTNTPVAGDTVTQASGASGTVVSYTANGNDSKLVVDVGAGTFANAQTTTVNFQNVAHANETPTPTAIVTSSGTGDGLGSNLELSPTLTTGIVTSVSAPAGADTRPDGQRHGRGDDQCIGLNSRRVHPSGGVDEYSSGKRYRDAGGRRVGHGRELHGQRGLFQTRRGRGHRHLQRRSNHRRFRRWPCQRNTDSHGDHHVQRR